MITGTSKNILLSGLFVILVAGHCFGMGGEIYPLTLRGNGMGFLGAALVDNQSFYYNPGSLGILALDNKIAAAGYVDKSYFGLNSSFYTASAAVRIIDFELWSGRAALGLAYNYKDFDLLLSEDYLDGNGVILHLGSTLHLFTLGFAYRSTFEYGVGFAGAYNKEDDDSPMKDYFSFSLGAIARFPLHNKLDLDLDDNHRLAITPSVGLSYINFGSAIEYEGVGLWFTTINYYEQIKNARLGLAVELGIDNIAKFSNWRLVSLLPTFEWASMRWGTPYSREGVELGLAEALYARVGYASDGPYGETTTYGFSVRSAGLVRLYLALTREDGQNLGPVADFLVNKMSLEYCMADNDYYSDWTDGFHGLLLNLEL